MTVAPSVAREAHRLVACPECGERRWLSARAARSVRLGNTTGRCDTCRSPRARQRTEAERLRFARWWLNRYSDAQLAELALGLGVEGACPENVARARRRLRSRA